MGRVIGGRRWEEVEEVMRLRCGAEGAGAAGPKGSGGCVIICGVPD